MHYFPGPAAEALEKQPDPVAHYSGKGSGWFALVPLPALQPARWATPGEFPNSPKAQFPYLDHGKNHHLSGRALGGLHEAARGKAEPRARHTVNTQ